MTLVLPHLAFPTTSSLHVETGSPLARLAARRAAVVLGPASPPSPLDGEEAERGTFCRGQNGWYGCVSMGDRGKLRTEPVPPMATKGPRTLTTSLEPQFRQHMDPDDDDEDPEPEPDAEATVESP